MAPSVKSTHPDVNHEYLDETDKSGIEICWNAGQEPELLQPAPDADQENPRKYYVYAHLDGNDKIFYAAPVQAQPTRDSHPQAARRPPPRTITSGHQLSCSRPKLMRPRFGSGGGAM